MRSVADLDITLSAVGLRRPIDKELQRPLESAKEFMAGKIGDFSCLAEESACFSS
jgi:hypothetical protein